MSQEIVEFDEMKNLGICVKSYIAEGKYKECEELLAYSMYLHPHAPEPHNLFGILLEKEQEHLLAMKHFRAALNLDPTYPPARQNLEVFGSLFDQPRVFAYNLDDCTTSESTKVGKVTKL